MTQHTHTSHGHTCCHDNEHDTHKHQHHEHVHEHDHAGHSHDGDVSFLPAIISFVLLAIGLVLDHWIQPTWFTGWVRMTLYCVAYIPVGLPVIKEAWESMLKKDIFSEFLLMSIATIGAFGIGEYPEGVAVMLFYAVGESFQSLAVKRAKSNIKSLLDQRPDTVTILADNQPIVKQAITVSVGEIIQLKAGEKLALDGELISETATFNTSALTGESKPDTKRKGEPVLAGMLNLNSIALVKVTTAYQDSKLSKILDLVQTATKQKAPTELFIRKFANIYTPIVVGLAVAITLLPYLLVAEYHFQDWLYRALIFWVISCPCALVISIPLGYFGGIGAASKNGILFKGSNYLELMTKINTVVMDKTGTLTAGVFKVHAIVTNGMDKTDFIKTLAFEPFNPIFTPK